MTEESPTLEEPIVEEPKVETSVDDAATLAARLTELGIDDVSKVEGTVKAAREAGNLANLLGEERAKSASIEAQLREMQGQKTNVDPSDDYGVDLGSVVRKEMEGFWNNKQNEAQQMQQRQHQEFQKIRNNKNYKLVGADFEEYTKTPDYQSELMAGKSPSEIFNDMSTDKLREYLVTMKNAVEQRTTAPGDVAIPHTESSQAPPTAEVSEDDKSEKLKQIKKDWKGDDSDISKVLDVLF
jgi:hypothetical protein